MKYALHLEAALSPPCVFAWVPYRKLDELMTGFGKEFPGFAVLGMFLWCVAAAAVGHLAHDRFRQLTHRDEWVPEPAAAPRKEPAPPTTGPGSVRTGL